MPATAPYYRCAKELKEGALSCRDLQMPMGNLNDILLRHGEKHILPPARPENLLAETKGAITRRLELVEKGLVGLKEAEFRKRMVPLQFRRDELSDDITALHTRRIKSGPCQRCTVRHHCARRFRSLLFESGAPERIRTSDPQIRSLVLYPAELRSR